MNKNLLNRNLFLFLLITGVSLGGLIVYVKNNMSISKSEMTTSAYLGNSTQASQKTNQVDKQTIQNFDINESVEKNMEEDKTQNTNTATSPTPTPITEVKELKVVDLVVGSGQEVKVGNIAVVNYTGTFLNGQKFDSSYDRNQPFEFSVGAGQVIKGWDQGVVGMKVGGKRELLIPSDLAYGAQGAPGAIPPNTPLRFEIELVAVK